MSTAIATRAHDVFLTYHPSDAAAAAQVRQAFQAEGLSVYLTDWRGEPDSFDEARRALAESEAVVILATAAAVVSPDLATGYGVAIAWQKPIYVVTKDLSRAALPAYLRSYSVYSWESLHKVAENIFRGKVELADEERQWLRSWYAEHGVPLDQLLVNPAVPDDLTRDFRQTWHRDVPAERLLRELFRLRKQGKLPRVRSN